MERLSARRHDDATVSISCNGHITPADVMALDRALIPLLQRGVRRLVVDAAAIAGFDAAVRGPATVLARRVRGQGIDDIVFVGAPPRVCLVAATIGVIAGLPMHFVERGSSVPVRAERAEDARGREPA